jgi:hypothetical protein
MRTSKDEIKLYTHTHTSKDVWQEILLGRFRIRSIIVLHFI